MKCLVFYYNTFTEGKKYYIKAEAHYLSWKKWAPDQGLFASCYKVFRLYS